MLLTDFCNRLTTRAPVDRPIPEREAFTSPTCTARSCDPPFRVDLSALRGAGATLPCGARSPESMRD
jgi:hypothetical protein